MSSKAAKRKEGFLKRESKRNAERNMRDAIKKATNLEDLAKAIGVKLR